jgi:hypothetical protein
MPTTYMGITLPTVSVTVGPTYATNINTAITTIDAHDHTTGKGTPVPSAGININANLSMGGYTLTATRAVVYTQQATFATANSFYFKTDGFAYVRSGAGTEIQLTTASALVTSTLAIYSQLSVTSNYVVLAGDTYTHFKVSTAAARVITLPSAAAVGAGRFYLFSDVTGSAATNNITISRAGSDTFQPGGTTSLVVASNGETVKLISDGVSAWYLESRVTTLSGYTGTVNMESALQWRSTVTTPTISQNTQTVTNDPGAQMTITAQIGNGTGAGGQLGLTAGVGGSTGAGGAASLQGGAAGGGNTAGGTVTVQGGTAQGSGAGGGATVRGGTGGSTGVGGDVTVRAGTAGGGNTAGGTAYLIGGAPTGTGLAGSVVIGDAGSYTLAVIQVASSSRIVSIGNATATSTNVPAGSGVVFIADGTMPSATAGSETPQDGWVLGSSSGRPCFKLGDVGGGYDGQRVILHGYSDSGATVQGSAGSWTITNEKNPTAMIYIILGGTSYYIPCYAQS